MVVEKKRSTRMPANSARYEKELILKKLNEMKAGWEETRIEAIQEAVEKINNWVERVEALKGPYTNFDEALKACIQPPFNTDVRVGLSYGHPAREANDRIHWIESCIERVNMMTDEDGTLVIKDGDQIWRVLFPMN